MISSFLCVTDIGCILIGRMCSAERMVSMKKYRVGVIGCTGMVGQRFVTLIDQHPWFELKVVAASARSAGGTVKFHGEDVTIQEATEDRM